MAAIAAAAALVHPRTRNYRHNNSFKRMNDRELRERYRFGSNGIRFVHNLLRDRLERQVKQAHTVDSLEQVLLALRYFGFGAFKQTLGDTIGRDKATVSRADTAVTTALCEIKDDLIIFPTSEDRKNEIKNSFYRNSGIPNVIGCIDGTHVRIMEPIPEQEGQLFNRKHFSSINVMTLCVCDNKGRFTFVNSKWPGSSHDSFVFRSSALSTYLDANNRRHEDGIILGDSGYTCMPYTCMMTPYRVEDTASKERFNRAHCRARVLIEMTFGRWKRRFGILHSEMRLKPLKASKVIIACAVLHNIAILLNEPDFDDILPNQPQPANQYNGPEEGRLIRDYITTTYFQ